MKGLLLKDYYLIIRRLKQFFIFIGILLILSIIDDSSSLFVIYPFVIVSLLPMTLISYDERDKWEEYAFCLPYSKKQMVCEKYLIGLIVNFVMLIIAALIQFVCAIIVKEFDLAVYTNLLVTIGGMCLLAPAFLLPLIFKLGVEKGRMFYYVFIGLFFAVAAIFATGEINEAKTLAPFDTYSSLTLLAISIVLYVLSVLLSIRFYEKRKS